MSKKEIAILIIGLLIFLIGALLNERVLANLATDGRIESSGQLLAIRFFNISCITAGLGIILLRKSSLVMNLMTSAAVLIILIFVLDTTLFLTSPWLPGSILQGLSPQAQLRSIAVNPGAADWVYLQNFRRGKPDRVVDGFLTDAMGYRNPPHYLDQNPAIDILLIGDSFTWGTEEKTIGDYLREALPLHTIYSSGIPGNGINHWRYHYQDFVENNPQGSVPQVVVLNYYSGNDLENTRLYSQVTQTQAVDHGAAYFAYYNYPYLLPRAGRGFQMPKLPELFFLANYVLVGFEQGRALSESLEVNDPHPILIDREPDPGEFDDRVMEQIELAVNTIRQVNPDSQIILSYIPTSGAVYGDVLSNCPECGGDVDRQRISSQRIEQFAGELDVHYVDFTPALQEYARSTILWAKDVHFSPAGYEIYSNLLAGEVKELMAGKE